MEITIKKKKNSKKGVWVSTYFEIREVPHNPKSKLLGKVFPVKVEFYDERLSFENLAKTINYKIGD